MIDVVVVVDRAAVAGVEEPVVDRRGGGVGLVPVALHDHVAAGEDLALAVERHRAADDRRAGAVQLDRPIGRA